MAELAETIDQAVMVTADREGKYLTFILGQEEYGIGISKIKEIIGMMPVTAVPRTPTFVKGVINLRGKVLPVVDLRLKFGMQEIEYTERTCIIVVEISGHAVDSQTGIVVDAVSEVLNIKAEDIEETPEFGSAVNTDYILGMAKMEGSVKILLDIDKVMSQLELESVSALAKGDSPQPADSPPEQPVAAPEQTNESEKSNGGKTNGMEMEKKTRKTQ